MSATSCEKPWASSAALGLVANGFALAALPAWAQNDKPLRVILPVGAGSGVDTIARAAASFLSKALGGQAVVVENLAGAGCITGASTLAKAAPDGLTIGLVSNNHVINPSVYKKIPYDTLADFTPISVMGATPFVLVVNPSKVAATNVKELIALVKAKPDGYNYASSGNGTVIHLAGEMFVDEAKVVIRHIPYKGTGPMGADLIGGQVEMGVVALPAVQAHLKSGALRAIGLCGKTRSPAAPDIPTIAEQVKRIHAAFVTAFNTPEMKEIMAKQGNVIHPSSPEAAAQYFRSEMTRYAALAKKAGVSLD
ncbi:MAG: tripartite tricarboxylate transporter substrate-binding protein [Rhodoferax sp.]|nr:tripartite tricarboxylate transporter substrate-binding protein [Rhodoferax sp.]